MKYLFLFVLSVVECYRVLNGESSCGRKVNCSAIYGNESNIYMAAADVALSLIGESAP